MLKRIYVDNYKCLVNFELRLDEITVLLGSNGTGKSSVLEVVCALRNLLSGRPKLTDSDAFPTQTLARWQARTTQTFELDIDSENTGPLTYRLEIEHDPRTERARVILERLVAPRGPLFEFRKGDVQLYRDDHSAGPRFTGDWSQSWLARFTSHKDNPRPARFLEYIERLVVCGLYPPAMAAESRAEESVIARDGSNFSAWYRGMLQERPDLGQAHSEALSELLEGFQGLRLERVGEDARVLKVVFLHGDRYELRFDRLSDGQRALIFLYALLYMNETPGQTLFLDEPDNYLALPEIQPWLMALSEAIGERVPQAIICSHHPELIDYLAPEQGRLLERAGGGPTTVRDVAALGSGGGLKLSEILARGWES